MDFIVLPQQRLLIGTRFRSAQSQFAKIGVPVLTAMPISMSAWASVDAQCNPIGIYNTGATATDNYVLRFHSIGLIAQKVQNSSSTTANTGQNVADRRPHHGCAVFESATVMYAYSDGGRKTLQGANVVPRAAQLAQTALIAAPTTTPSQFANALVFEPAIWNTALTDGQVARLAAGVSPLDIERANLKMFLTNDFGMRTRYYDYFNNFAMDFQGGQPTHEEWTAISRIYQRRIFPVRFISNAVSGSSSFGAGAQQTAFVEKRVVAVTSVNAGTQQTDSASKGASTTSLNIAGAQQTDTCQKRTTVVSIVLAGAQLTDTTTKRGVAATLVQSGAQLTDAVQKRAVSVTQMSAGSLFYSVGTSAESHSGISLFGIGGQLQSTVQKRGVQTTIVFAGGQLNDTARKQSANASVTSAGAQQTATVQKRAIAVTTVMSGAQQSTVGKKGAISVSALNTGSFFYSVGTSAESHSGTSTFGAGVFINAIGQKRAVNVTSVRAGVFETDTGRKGATGYSQSGSAAGFNATGSKSVTGASAFGSASRFTLISVKGAKGQTVVGAGSRFSYTMRPPATMILVASETVIIDVTPVAFHVERTSSVHWLSQDALVTDITPTVYVKEYK